MINMDERLATGIGLTPQRPEPTSIPEFASAEVEPEIPATHRQGSSARWWWAVLVAACLSIPFGWLLSYGGSLLFMLGLFFFVLFGLLLGAVAYRIASPARPLSPGAIVIGSAVIVSVCWSTALWKEVREVPRDLAAEAIRGTRHLGDRSAGEFRAALVARIQTYIAERHPPGGTLGTIRWIAAGGRIETKDLPELSRRLQRRADQCGSWWLSRLFLCLAGLGFGVGTQTWPLRRADRPAPNATPPSP
jgi:hypothetical protein